MSEMESSPQNGSTGQAPSNTEFSVDDFYQVVQRAFSEEAPNEAPSEGPVSEPPPEPPKKESVSEPPKPDELPQSSDQPIVKKPRSLEGLPPEVAPLFRQMSNEAYNKLYPAYLEYLKLKGSLEDKAKQEETLKNAVWWQMDGAWTLHPEYRELASNAERLNYETSFWKRQLANIESGQPWTELYIDPKTGEYLEGPPQEASPEAKANVITQLNKAILYSQEVGKRLEDFSSKFKSQFSTLNDSLVKVDKELFGELDTKKWGPKIEQWLSHFPEPLRMRPEYQMLAKAATVIEGLALALKRYEAQKGLQKEVDRIGKSSGPSQGMTSPSSSSEDPDKLWKSFQRMTGVIS